MKPHHFGDAYWTVRFAPYLLAVALIYLAVSLFWGVPPASYALVGTLTGALISVFHSLKWRKGREAFQYLAMVCMAFAVFFVIHRHNSSEILQPLQFIAFFYGSYAIGILLFARRLLPDSRPS